MVADSPPKMTLLEKFISLSGGIARAGLGVLANFLAFSFAQRFESSVQIIVVSTCVLFGGMNLNVEFR